MKIYLVSISARRTPPGVSGSLVDLYISRAARYTPTEQRSFPSEAKLLSFLDDASARTRPLLWLADSGGEPLSSPELAGALTQAFDSGAQTLLFAIGPADGWSVAARKRADKTVAFGRITLPHELAAVVAAEQIYRALTIRAGHPYHSGH